MVIWVICPASMSKSSVRQRDLSHPAFGPVTCYYAKRWREVNTTWEYLIWKCNSGCNKSYIKSICFTSTAQKFKLFGVCYLDLQNYLKLIPPRRFFFSQDNWKPVMKNMFAVLEMYVHPKSSVSKKNFFARLTLCCL